ncbi:hypothetical protein SBA3_2760046 [Candidatus Sulfopaludibacter sp. SbA3]|nr:hypothetical protein SBA3_2760046 [Candidatus Sulfopaludibacter sp. SbA3]
MKMRQQVDVDLEELDQIIDRGTRAPLSEAEGQKLKAVIHVMAAKLEPKRNSEKASAVLPADAASAGKPKTGEWSRAPWRRGVYRRDLATLGATVLLFCPPNHRDATENVPENIIDRLAKSTPAFVAIGRLSSSSQKPVDQRKTFPKSSNRNKWSHPPAARLLGTPLSQA